MVPANISVRCCIAGGGPAGMMLGLLLARAGVDVLVLEKHADFLRDFRGDTIHPSTLEVMHELGLLDELLKLPHQKTPQLNGIFGGLALTIADFSHLPVRCPYIAFMPQWDFLNFIARHASRYPTFTLRMQAEVTGLIEEDRRVVGLRATTPEGPLEVRAGLVVGADGRHSVVREKAALTVEELGAPMDVLWFQLPRRVSDGSDVVGRIDPGRMLIRFSRGSYWQCAYIIPKGGFEQVKSAGLKAFQEKLASSAPVLADRANAIASFDELKLLSVRVDRLERWHKPGFLCIGDAAHAMSPVGGVGVNLAVQDAVAAANILWKPLREGTLTDPHLAAVQRRREWPARAVQFIQVQVQNRLIAAALRSQTVIRPPALLRLISRVPALQNFAGRVVGLGIRREHVSAPELAQPV